MSEAADIEQVIKILRQVPTKSLLIIELANRIPVVDGQLEYKELTNRRAEIKLAIDEAKAYGTATIQAVETLTLIRAVPHV